MMNRNAPRTLYRYLFRELVTIFGMSLLALSLLFLVVLGIQAVQGGYSLRIILPWMLESLSYSFYFTAPLSLLVASTLGYGRFVADSEYTAAIASGLSPLHIAMPMLVLSAGLCAIGLATQGTVLPRAHYKQRNITRYLVKQLEHIGDSKKGKLQIDKRDGMVYWDEIKDGHLLRGVHIEKKIPLGTFSANSDSEPLEVDEDNLDPDFPIPPTFLNADKAVLEVDSNAEAINLTLYGVAVTVPNPDRGYLFRQSGMTKHHEVYHLVKLEVQFPINEKSKREGDWTNHELRERIHDQRKKVVFFKEEVARLESLRKPAGGDGEPSAEEVQYQKAVESLAYHERRVTKAQSQIWFRVALALSLFTFGFIGFPISITFRHNHKMVPFFIGVMLIVAVFYPLLLLGEALVKSQGLPAMWCMLSGNLVLLAVGAFLSAKLVTR